MAPVDGFSVRAILRARDRIGPRAALALARGRAQTLPPGDDRLRLLEVALESAFLAGDERSLLSLARSWSLEASRRPSDIAVTLALELRARGSAYAARALARAEADRSGSGAAFLALAAALEDVGDAVGALEALASARTASFDVARRALVETLRLAISRRALDEGVVARAIELLAELRSHFDDRDALIVAAASLRASSRFDRALALDELVRIARESPQGPRTRALRIGLEHADCHSGRLSELEHERLVVLVQAALPAGAERAALERELEAHRSSPGSLERTALLGADRARRAHAVLSGGEPGPSPGAGQPLGEWRALSALAMLHAGRDDDAARALDALESDPRPTPAWWAVTLAAAERPVLAARIPGVVEHLTRTLTPAPRPLAEIAARLEASGQESACLVVHRAARAAGETGAREALAQALLRAGWRAARSGDRDGAIALLREARAASG